MLKNYTEAFTTVKYWFRCLTSFVNELFLEWFKLTTTLALILLFPLFAYILWDLITTDLTLAQWFYYTITYWLINNIGAYLLILSVVIYLTYL